MTHNTYSVVAANNKEAERIFNRAGMRLLNTNFWCKLFDNNNPCRLFNKNGNEVKRLIKKSDFFRVGLTGAGGTEKENYNWISVDNIESYTDYSLEMELFTVIIRPSLHPFEGSVPAEAPISEAIPTALSVKRESGKITIELHKSTNQPTKVLDSKLHQATNESIHYPVPASKWENIVSALFS